MKREKYINPFKGKIIPIGSFKSNSVVRRKKIKKSIELLYISVFRPHPYKTKNEDYVLFQNLKNFVIKKISLQVLGATNFSEEKFFYNKIFGTKMNKFINRYEKEMLIK